MVFFNYSTMQMAAKIVYYGPGLCGKTTNLHYIYSRTSNDSRGEMVSLETETDRTLFFDLLPIDVGSIAGFNTRIQLYTVPGQVFYNTTRKLVLKGVDGVVFVADSQRAMLEANKESFENLGENLQEMGLDVSSMPLVFQYNKRDLPDICSVEELDSALNVQNRPHFESAAILGKGVFETLKGISKLTLLSLKQRLVPSSDAAGSRPARPVPAPTKEAPTKAPAGRTSPAPPPAKQPARAARGAAVSPPPTRTAVRKTVDVMGELEKLRRDAMKSSPALRARASANGRGEISRTVELHLARPDFDRVRRFSLRLQVEDESHQVLDTLPDLRVEVDSPESFAKVLLKLNIALNAKE